METSCKTYFMSDEINELKKKKKKNVVSKSDSVHGNGFYGHRTLGLMPAGTICHSTLSLGQYPILRDWSLITVFPPAFSTLDINLTEVKSDNRAVLCFTLLPYTE